MRRLPFLALAAALTLAACSKDSPTAPPAPVVKPTQIRVQNATSYSVVGVYVSACNAATWGVNRLNPGTLIAPSTGMAFPVTAGCWDLKVIDSINHYGTVMGAWVNDQETITVTFYP